MHFGAEVLDPTVFAAFGVGVLSFVSPCVLPLVPGYISAISGVSYVELEEGSSKLKILGPALIFCLSFTAMFVALGLAASGIGQTLGENRDTIRHVSGVLLVLMGLLFIGTLFVPMLNREWRPDALMSRVAKGGPVIAGLAFAVAWLPCTGPTLGAILTAAGTSDTVGKGGVLLAFYSLGLAVPFLLSALAFSYVSRGFKILRDHYTVITAVSGLILVVMGVLLYQNELTRLNGYANDLGLNLIENL
ncbi:MAG: cytochrome c biogenesis protein CcdA [Thermoleophilaceae bacterium]|nr:cytochrome c biogenesis protein CcdA [Thermoleophilaceae bacterium]